MNPAAGGEAAAACVEHAERMRALLRRSIARHGAVDHGGDAIKHKTDERKHDRCELQRQQQDRHIPLS